MLDNYDIMSSLLQHLLVSICILFLAFVSQAKAWKLHPYSANAATKKSIHDALKISLAVAVPTVANAYGPVDEQKVKKPKKAQVKEVD